MRTCISAGRPGVRQPVFHTGKNLRLKPGGASLCSLAMSEHPDKLHEIFRMQEALNRRIGVDTTAMSEMKRRPSGC